MIPRFEVIDIGPAPNPHPATARSITTREIATVHDQRHWVGKEVQTDDERRWRVLATERFAHAPPWAPGEPLVLVVAPIPTQPTEAKTMTDTPCPAAAAAERACALIQTIRDFDRGTMVHPETAAAEEQLVVVEASALDLRASSPTGAFFLLALANSVLGGDLSPSDVESARKLIQSAAGFLEPQVPGGKGNLDYYL